MPSKKFRIVHRIPNSNILIDYWKPVSQEKYYRFMTFLKIDTNESIKEICESTYTIYTSLFNKWYLITYYQVSEHRLIDIRPNETKDIYDAPSGTTFSVTAFDANYYTGSLMFLFQGSFGNVLYTGFFRPCSLDPILRNPVLKAVMNKRELDVAFIDNTYAAEHCDFPTRKEVLNQIVTCLKQHPNHEVSISGKRLGKEEILLEIAKALDEKIWVTEEKFVILSRLNVQNHFTTDKNKSRIYACDYIINPKQCMRRQALGGAQIIILLTAYYQCADGISKEELNIPNLHIFPYSGHCSHPELKRFISYLRPREVQPIIKFEDSALPNSIIPKSLYELCSMPPPPTYSRFSNCCRCRLDVSNMTPVSPTNAVNADSPICNVPGEKSMVPSTGTNVIAEMKYLDNIDEFLKTVAETNNVSNFQNSTETCSTSYQSPSSDLNRSIIADILADPQTSNVSFYTEVTTDDDQIISNSIVVENLQQSSPVINDPIPNNSDNNFPDSEIMQMLNERSFPVAENIVPEFTATCSPANENTISTSSPPLNNPIIVMDLTKMPQNTVYSTYTENDIAENIISSTNNDNLSDISFSSPETIIEKVQDVTSPNNAAVDLDTRIDVDPLDLLEEDAHAVPIEQMDVEIMEKQPELIYTKTYDTKSTQTDLTIEKIAQLEERAEMNERSLNEIIKERVIKHAQVAHFDTEKYYEKLRLRSIKHGTDSNCNIENCQECKIAVEQQESQRKRKLMNLAVYSRAKVRKMNTIEEKLNRLNGCDIFSHPIFKS